MLLLMPACTLTSWRDKGERESFEQVDDPQGLGQNPHGFRFSWSAHESPLRRFQVTFYSIKRRRHTSLRKTSFFCHAKNPVRCGVLSCWRGRRRDPSPVPPRLMRTPAAVHPLPLERVANLSLWSPCNWGGECGYFSTSRDRSQNHSPLRGERVDRCRRFYEPERDG